LKNYKETQSNSHDPQENCCSDFKRVESVWTVVVAPPPVNVRTSGMQNFKSMAVCGVGEGKLTV
jgi:hypothetical protein